MPDYRVIDHGPALRNLVIGQGCLIGCPGILDDHFQSWQIGVVRFQVAQHRRVIGFEKMVAGDQHAGIGMVDQIFQFAVCHPCVQADHNGSQ